MKAYIELDDDMRAIEKKIVSILPDEKEKAIAIILHLSEVMKREFEVDNWVIVEDE